MPRLFWPLALLTLLSVLAVALPSVSFAQAAGTGTITGRVMNAGTGDYLRNAVVSVVGTNLATLAEAGGNYRLLNVPAGDVRLRVEFTSLNTVEETVTVAPGASVTKDFSLTGSQYDKDLVMLDRYVVAGEREGNAKALMEQRTAVNMKTVIASDAFGDVSEGNVGEFMKRMPGISIDYVESDARQIRIRGMNPKYAQILMDGAPIASAGSSSISTGRAFELEQLSISSIESIEMSKTPTPDQNASAVAGVVNLRSKGAFDSKGRRIDLKTGFAVNSYSMFEKSPGPADKESYKIQPNFSLTYADVLISNKLGIQMGVNLSKTFAEQKAETVAYRWDLDGTNNDTEVPLITGFGFRDSPKMSTRKNYNLRLDFKLNPDAWFYTRVDYNTYEGRFFSRDISVNLASTTAGQGTINSTATNSGSTVSPVDPNVPYSYNSQTSQLASTNIANTSFNAGGGATNKHGATFTWTTYGEYTMGALKVDAQGQFSRATNWYSDVPYGFLWAMGTRNLTGTQLRFDRNGPEDMAVKFTQLSGPNWTDLGNYRVNTVLSNDRASDDEKYSGQINFKYPVEWKIPVNLKWGFAVNEAARNVYLRQNNQSYTFVGADHTANTADDAAMPFAEPYYRMSFDNGSSADANLTNLDRWALARAFTDHPDWFTGPTQAQLLQTRLTNTWNLHEQINAGYFQSIFKLNKLTIAPGLRYEFTRTRGKGPSDIGNAAAQVLLGNPRSTAAPTAAAASYDYVLARYGSGRSSGGTTYGDLFKYLHLTYSISDNLMVRASFHDSITRPDLANIFFSYSVTNDTADPRTANVNNPELKPEYSRSLNLDLEYYFGQGGYFIVGAFRTDIKDLQRRRNFDTDDEGRIEGFDLILPQLASTGADRWRVSLWDNVDNSHNQGFEANYLHPLTFLPGPFKNLTVFANHTHLVYDKWSNYLNSPKDISNAGMSYKYAKFNARLGVNRTGYFLTGTRANSGSVNAGIASYQRQRTMFDASVGYDITKTFSAFANGRNIFNEPLRTYQLSGKVLNREAKFGALWEAGIKGRF